MARFKELPVEIGNWRITSEAPTGSARTVMCDCLVCGRQSIIRTIYPILNGKSTSCGCDRGLKARKNLLADIAPGELRLELSFLRHDSDLKRIVVRCSCGSETAILRSAWGRQVRCGKCGRHEAKQERTFQKAHAVGSRNAYRLTVKEVLGFRNRRLEYLAICDCGKSLTVSTSAFNTTKSCGCAQLEAVRTTIESNRVKLGYQPDAMVSGPAIHLRMLLKPLMATVLMRDEFTCAVCKRVGGKLHVHHLIGLADNPAVCDDPRNLVTLCKECHIDGVHAGNPFAPVSPEQTKLLINLVAERPLLHWLRTPAIQAQIRKLLALRAA